MQISLFIIALLAVGECVAQTDTVSASYNIKGVEVLGVSGNSPLQKTAPAYSVSSANFGKLNITDMTSAVRRLPGITLRDYGGAGGMKTISVRGMGSTHTGVAVDGLLQPDGLAGDVNIQQFSISEINSMQLSVMGSDDVFQSARNLSKASLLNLTTRANAGFAVKVESGSWQHVSSTLSYSQQKSNASYSLKGGYMRAKNDYPFVVHNGVATHKERRVNSAMQQAFVNAVAKWQLNATTNIAIGARLSDNDRELPGIVRLYVNNNEETLRNRSSTLHSQFNTLLAKNLYLKTSVRWHWAEQDYKNGTVGGGIRSEKYLSVEYYATASLKYNGVRNVDISYSADYWHDAMNTTLRGNKNPHRNSFLQAVSGKWMHKYMSITASVLNSNIDKEHQLSPTMSVVWKPFRSEKIYIRLNAKSIFRMPTMTEMYYFHFGEQNLKPENTRQLNLGLVFQNDGVGHKPLSVDASVNAYINSVDDKIVAIPFNMFVWRYVNLTTVHGRGIDAVANIRYSFAPKHSIGITTNYALQSIRNIPVNKAFATMQIAYVPVHSGSVTLNWDNPFCGMAITGVAASKTWATNEHHAQTDIAEYADFSASVYKSFRIKRSKLSVRFVMENIFNYDYEIVANYPMPRRNWKLSAEFQL